MPKLDELVVRHAGGETSDFGNGSDDVCGTSTTYTEISESEAREIADLDVDRTLFDQLQRGVLHWSQADCAASLEACEETEVELRAEIDSYIRVDARSSRPSPMCAAEGHSIAYRALVRMRTSDGRSGGAFYARLSRGADASGNRVLRARANPDLRNFAGNLPLQIDLDRPHYAYAELSLELGPNGATKGSLQPTVAYFEDRVSTQRIAAQAVWSPTGEIERRQTPDALPGADQVTLSSYHGPRVEPQLKLSARVESVEPVEVTIRVNGRVVEQGSADPDQEFDLGEHPLGTQLSMDVHNPSGAGKVRAVLLQEPCGSASANCDEADCTAHAEYTSEFRLCPVY